MFDVDVMALLTREVLRERAPALIAESCAWSVGLSDQPHHLRRGGRLFHYTGMPNRLTSGRDVPREVVKRLEKAGFRAAPALDGVFATRR